ncbi:hypothetical protein RchiOBHm_Chr1g0317641 [Rosa chinensis]|uniref:Uncharacterized protein n=1 Tax=Rosa chinensis TaxID=74649 RepID=A0A2P6S7X5_ROSCH|nr:hypothetical protein RchiOBHm_Chr1g0317641 [Rosa chinensis]
MTRNSDLTGNLPSGDDTATRWCRLNTLLSADTLRSRIVQSLNEERESTPESFGSYGNISALSSNSGHRLRCMWCENSSSHYVLHASLNSFRIRLSSSEIVFLG